MLGAITMPIEYDVVTIDIPRAKFVSSHKSAIMHFEMISNPIKNKYIKMSVFTYLIGQNNVGQK